MKRLYLLGDSTCADKRKDARPETGWGEEIYDYLAPDWVVVNCAVNGYSTSMCLQTGTFGSVLLSARAGDAVIIQFAHNDEHKEEKGTRPFVEYLANLKYMAEKLQEKKISVYFLTPVPRRKFVDFRLRDSHGDYIAAMKYAAYLANVPCADITAPAMADLAAKGEAESKGYYMNFKAGVYTNYMDGKEDNTHLRPEGARWIAGIIAEELSALSSKPEFLK